ncbi:hypothetical protein WN943_015006 [Citrus x changshan-huyou]
MMMFLAFSRSSLSLFFFVISIFSLSFWSFSTVVESHTAIDVCDSKHRPVSCPVKCFTTDPVCGMDGVTYWCGCDEARCAGATVAKKGFCQVGDNGGTASLSAQALLLVHIVWLIIIGISVFNALAGGRSKAGHTVMNLEPLESSFRDLCNGGTNAIQKGDGNLTPASNGVLICNAMMIKLVGRL